MSTKSVFVLTLALLPLASGAWAADATPEGAQALEQQVRSWIAGTLGPTVKLPARPIQVSPEGDHYIIAAPLGDAPDAPRLTAVARPSDGGRWTIDNIRVPSPTTFKVNLPDPADKDANGSPRTIPVTYDLRIGTQAGQILFDPSYATASTLNVSAQNIDLAATGEGFEQTSHMDRTATTSTLRPAAAGRVDLLMDGTTEGYRIGTKMAGPENLDIGMDRARVTGEVDGVSRERGVQVLQALIEIGAAINAAGKTGASAPAIDEKTTQTLLDALGDFATAMSLDETIDHLAVGYNGMSGSLNKLRIGFNSHSDAGVLSARMDLGADGLTLPELGLGDMVQLIPTRLALRPFVTGVATADIARIAQASKGGVSPSPEDIQRLFSHGGITAGLDSFSVEVAGSTFTGMGKLVFTSPEAFGGTAQITATDLDLLQQRVAANPQLAQALPVFVVAKGIGRTINNQIVWDISYQNGRILVNNQDLSALTGGGGGGQQPAPPQGRRPQQQRR